VFCLCTCNLGIVWINDLIKHFSISV
jgi:hypothetical protein